MGWQKDTAGMRPTDYPKEKIENDPLALDDFTIWMLRTGLWRCLHITAFA
jgi:hypothetical protein